MSAQLPLMAACGDAALVAVDDVGRGLVLHLPGGSLRVQGRASNGTYLAHRCDRAGLDLRPTQVVAVPESMVPRCKAVGGRRDG